MHTPASKRNGTLYIGVTSNLIKSVWEHKNDMIEGFTKRYKVHRRVWFEIHTRMIDAIGRDKQLRDWKRQWKRVLIEQTNPDWVDSYDTII